MHWGVLLFMILTTLVLILGVGGMMKGGTWSGHTATKFMSMRIIFQAIAIALLVLTAVITG